MNAWCLVLYLCGVGSVDLRWVFNVDLEDLAGGRRCGRRDVVMGVCIVGSSKFASDRIFKYVLDDTPASQRWSATSVSVK